MKTIKNSKEITTLEVGDKVIFGDLEYIVRQISMSSHYYLYVPNAENAQIFKNLHIDIQNFINKLGIICDYDKMYFSAGVFPECHSLEALTAIVSALFKEYEKQMILPTTWKEFCANNLIKEGEYYIGLMSNVCPHASGNVRMPNVDRNVCTSKSEAEAFIALMQLRQLRKTYVKDWEPDWTKSSDKYCINYCEDRIKMDHWTYRSHALSFPTYELAEQFLTNFKDLIEIAKPLL